MSFSLLAALRPVRICLRAAFLGAIVALAGCATHYVDGSVKEIAPAQFTRPARPGPVQLVFEFQTKGAANARATEKIKPMAVESLKDSGLFSQIDEKPLPGGALLSVVINNIVLTDDAYSKGFMTGLTLGAAGSTVTDGYVCTVKYVVPGAGGATITKTARHAIHTTLGSAGAPANAVKAASIEEAVRSMVRQVLSNAMNDLSKDAAFK